jgi:hypothetical protein
MNAELTADDRELVRDIADPSIPLDRVAESRGLTLAAVRERLRAPAARAEIAARRALINLRADLLADEARVQAIVRLRRHAADEPDSPGEAQPAALRAREASRKAAALLIRPPSAPPGRRRRPGRPFAPAAPSSDHPRPAHPDAGVRHESVGRATVEPAARTGFPIASHTGEDRAEAGHEGPAPPLDLPLLSELALTPASMLARSAGRAISATHGILSRAGGRPSAPT